MRIVLFVLSGLICASANALTVQDIRGQIDKRDPAALVNAESFTKANPKLAEAWIELTRARLQAKKSELAIRAGEVAVKLSPQNAQTHYWLGNANGQRIGEVGMLSKLSIAGEMRDAFETAVKLDPNLLDARDSLIQYYVQAPSIAGGSKDKAKLQASEIAKRDVARGHLAYAQIYMAEENKEAAIKSYEAAYKIKPEDKNIRLALGIGYQNLQRWNDAFKHFREWTTQDPNAGTAWYQIGRSAALSGQQGEEGIAALKKYLTFSHTLNEPQNQHAHFRMGQIYAKIGKKVEAKIALQTALKIDPTLSDAKAELKKL